MKQASNLTIFGDGGSRGNPGEAAYGFVVKDTDTDKIIYEEGKRLGIATNNFAEYHAVIKALEWVKLHDKNAETIHFKLDSLLVASQMNGKYRVKHPDMKKLFLTAKGLERELSAQIIYSQIPRALNSEADRLVNDALDFKI